MNWKELLIVFLVGVIIGIAGTTYFFKFKIKKDENYYKNHIAIGKWISSDNGQLTVYPEGIGSYIGIQKFTWKPIGPNVIIIELKIEELDVLIDFRITKKDEKWFGTIIFMGREVTFHKID